MAMTMAMTMAMKMIDMTMGEGGYTYISFYPSINSSLLIRWTENVDLEIITYTVMSIVSYTYI